MTRIRRAFAATVIGLAVAAGAAPAYAADIVLTQQPKTAQSDGTDRKPVDIPIP